MPSTPFLVLLRAEEASDQHALRHECRTRLRQRYQVEGIEMPPMNRAAYAKGRVLTPGSLV